MFGLGDFLGGYDLGGLGLLAGLVVVHGLSGVGSGNVDVDVDYRRSGFGLGLFSVVVRHLAFAHLPLVVHVESLVYLFLGGFVLQGFLNVMCLQTRHQFLQGCHFYFLKSTKPFFRKTPKHLKYHTSMFCIFSAQNPTVSKCTRCNFGKHLAM